MAGEDLGSRLKAERESRGFTLHDVSASTKIPVALLEALERDDLSRWPKGFYRRAFFRSYLTALGLPAEPLAGEFARLFPDERSDPPPAVFAGASRRANSPDEPLVVTSAGPAAERVWRSVAVALVELAAVLAAGGLVGWVAGMTLLAASGTVALIYYPFIRAAAGRVRRSSDVTRPPAASTAPRALIPSADRGQTAPTNVHRSAAPRIRLGLATSRLRLAPLHAHAARSWLPLATRITTTANHGMWRAGTGTVRVLRHGAQVTFEICSRFVTWTSDALWRAGTRTARVLRHGAQATFQLSSRVTTWTSDILWRAGIRAGHVLSHGAEATFQASSRVVTWTSLLLWRTGTGSRRALQAAAKYTSHVFLCVLRTVNRAFWTGVRAAAEHAELFAAKRLDRSGE